jgi:TonB family protein
VVVFPFEEPPAALRGTEVRARFWVDARGQVQKVVIEPPIEDSSFRKKLLERLSQWTFYPARTVDGRAVAGQVLVTIPY